VYLLHGYSGDYLTWTRVAPLDEYADRYHVVFVCPDGNFNSWYMDSPVRADSKFESYIVDDVVPFIDKNYRTWAQARGRAIIGSSMGGHGPRQFLQSIAAFLRRRQHQRNNGPHRIPIAMGFARGPRRIPHKRRPVEIVLFLMLCEKLVGPK